MSTIDNESKPDQLSERGNVVVLLMVGAIEPVPKDHMLAVVDSMACDNYVNALVV